MNFTLGLGGILASAALVTASTAWASGNLECGAVHVRHSVHVNQAATCVVAPLFEPQAFCLTDADGHDLEGVQFEAVPGSPSTFGMSFRSDADFNMEYALTCVAKDGLLAKSPKVIFTIGADGPGVPHIDMIELYGAQGSWTSVRGDMDFQVNF